MEEQNMPYLVAPRPDVPSSPIPSGPVISHPVPVLRVPSNLIPSSVSRPISSCPAPPRIPSHPIPPRLHPAPVPVHSLQHGVALFLGRALVGAELPFPALHVLFVLLLGLRQVELVLGHVAGDDLLLQRPLGRVVPLHLDRGEVTGGHGG